MKNETKNKDGQIFNLESNSIDSYSCSYSDGLKVWAGRLYIFEENICFYSNLLVTTTKLILPMNEITSIENKNNKLLSSIDIVTEKKRFSFISFFNREEAHKKLMDVWDKKENKLVSKEDKSSDSQEENNKENTDGWDLLKPPHGTRKRASSAPSQMELQRKESMLNLIHGKDNGKENGKENTKENVKENVSNSVSNYATNLKDFNNTDIPKLKSFPFSTYQDKSPRKDLTNITKSNSVTTPINTTIKKISAKKNSDERTLLGDVEMKSISSPNNKSNLIGSVIIDDDDDDNYNTPPIKQSKTSELMEQSKKETEQRPPSPLGKKEDSPQQQQQQQNPPSPKNSKTSTEEQQNQQNPQQNQQNQQVLPPKRPRTPSPPPVFKPEAVGNCEHWVEPKATHENIEFDLDITLEGFYNSFFDREGTCFCEYHKKRDFGGKSGEFLKNYPTVGPHSGCCCFTRNLMILITTKGGTMFPDTTTRANITHRWFFKDEKTLYFHSSSEALDIPQLVKGKFTAESRMIATEENGTVHIRLFFEPKFLGMTFGLSKFIGKKVEEEGKEYFLPLVEFWKSKIVELNLNKKANENDTEITNNKLDLENSLDNLQISSNSDSNSNSSDQNKIVEEMDPLTNKYVAKKPPPSPIKTRTPTHQRKNSNPIIGLRHSSPINVMARGPLFSVNNLFALLFVLMFIFFLYTSHVQSTQILQLQEKLLLSHHMIHRFDSKMEEFLLSFSKNLTDFQSDNLERHWDKVWRDKCDLINEEKLFFDQYFERLAAKNKQKDEAARNKKARVILDMMKQYYEEKN